jgi:two-component system sensor histidine kinase PilS (NtrC family)
MEPSRRTLRFYGAIRLVVVLAIVLSAILIQATAGLALPLSYLYGVGGCAAALSLFLYATDTRLPGRVSAGIQLGGDLVLVTALVYFSGGSDSVFSFLYLVVVGAGSFLLLRPGGLLTASLASVLYGAMIELAAYGMLPPPPLSEPPERAEHSLYALVVNILAFYSVALLTALIAEKLSAARSEVMLRRTEVDRLRSLHADVIDSMSSGLAAVDDEGRMTFLNRAGAEILGTARSAAPGRWVWDVGLLTQGEFTSAVGSNDADEFARGEAVIDVEGARRLIGYSVRPLRGASGHLILFQDLTELRRLEEEARARDKLAAIGKLAAGIAHEIRNPLASISGSAQMLGNEMARGSSERRLIEIIVSESVRLSKILEDFLRYTRPGPRRVESFDVASSLLEAMDLFSNSDEVGDHHRLELQVDPPRSLMQGDPDQIRQIFWNVAKNAVRAMPDGGMLEVRGREDGAWYRIVFRDTGRGMTSEERDALFQPFATAFDEGTGLGMAIVRRLTEDHGGTIRVDSRPGEGTRIEIRLPRGKIPDARSSAA